MTFPAKKLSYTRGAVLEVGVDGVPAITDGVFEALPGAWVPHVPATAYPRFKGLPVLIWVTLAQVVAIAVCWLVCHVGEAALGAVVL